MNAKIFVNLPVKDLAKSMDFYTKIGFVNNPQFTDHTAAAMMLNENIFVMLLTHDKFREFTPKEIADAGKVTQVINCISLDSKEELMDMLRIAIEAGSAEVRPEQNYGFMYGRSFYDPDEHIWEIVWMDLNYVETQG